MLYAITRNHPTNAKLKLWYSDFFKAWVPAHNTLPMGTMLFDSEESAKAKARELSGRVEHLG